MNILINKYKFCQYFLQRLSFKEQKMIQNMDWTGLDSWTVQLDWTIGLDFEWDSFSLNRRNLTDSKIYEMFLRKTK